MSDDPLYGPNAQHPEDDTSDVPVGLSDAVIEQQVKDMRQRKHDAQAHRSETRAPRDRMLKLPRRNR